MGRIFGFEEIKSLIADEGKLLSGVQKSSSTLMRQKRGRLTYEYLSQVGWDRINKSVDILPTLAARTEKEKELRALTDAMHFLRQLQHLAVEVYAFSEKDVYSRPSHYPDCFRVHDLSKEPVFTYLVESPARALSETDRIAMETAANCGDMITMGKIVVEPIYEHKEED